MRLRSNPRLSINVITGLIAGLILLAAGCDTNVAYVQGTTLFEGKPVAAGTRVLFERPGTGYVAVGVVQPDGSFTLQYKMSEKIEPGEYIVFMAPPQANYSQEEFYALKAKVDAEFKKKGKKPPPSPDWILPTDYYQSSTSPLRQTVERGANVVQVEL